MKNEILPFYQVPKILFKYVSKGEITHIDLLLYVIISDRLKFTKFYDEDGKYIFISYTELLELLNVKKRNIISDSLKRLHKLNLIHSKYLRGRKTKYYISDINDSLILK